MYWGKMDSVLSSIKVIPMQRYILSVSDCLWNRYFVFDNKVLAAVSLDRPLRVMTFMSLFINDWLFFT